MTDPSPLPPQADRRFEAVVLWSTFPTISDRTAEAVVGLRDAGMPVGVVAPMRLDDLARRFGDRSDPAGSLLLADSEDPAVLSLWTDGTQREISSRAPTHDRQSEVLDRTGRNFVGKLADLGISTAPLTRPGDPVKIQVELLADGDARTKPQGFEEFLLAHGIPSVASLVELASDAAREAGIEDPRVLVEANTVAIAYEDAGDAAVAMLLDLWRLGVGPKDVMLLLDGSSGVPHRPPPVIYPDVRTATVVVVDGSRSSPASTGDPAAATATRPAVDDVLLDQLRRRSQGALPEPTTEDGWSVNVEGFDVETQRVHESLLTVADGHFGFSGSPLIEHPYRQPWAVAGGVYQGTGSDSRLLTAPGPFELRGIEREGSLSRVLDLRTGMMHERYAAEEGGLESVRFACLTRPTTAVLRVLSPHTVAPEEPLAAPAEDPISDSGRTGDVAWVRVEASQGGVVAAARDSTAAGTTEGAGHLDRVVAYVADSATLPELSPALELLELATSVGFDRLLSEHRQAWARRWEDADVVVEGDEELQLGIRLSLFQLMTSVASSGEAAIGARGLTGSGYRGHVFWDADTFVLPFLAATHPPSARAMLEYRLRRLPAAIESARALGREGARFPWESAHTGKDVTPTSARDRQGRLVPIRTGQLEEHIVAEVAWAACCYTDWTGDEEFTRGPGLRILVETARYWASRIRLEPDGSAHIYGVIGPDEYHEPVDDNAFTNVMARWNMRRAADAVDNARAANADEEEPDVDASERSRWLELADALVDGYDPDTGIYEQFAGFGRLEPLIISEVAPRRPIAADLLLGIERTRASQVVKQADVLMLHHLVPDEVVSGSLEPNLRYYEPRTAHGSSLSPAIHASLLARARDFDSALEALRIAARMDLDDLSGSSGQGLHVATMGGLWQALAFGFAGLHPRAGMLHVDPVLPPSWTALELRLRFLGSRVRIRKEKARLSITTDRRIAVVVSGTPFTVDPGTISLHRRGAGWELDS